MEAKAFADVAPRALIIQNPVNYKANNRVSIELQRTGYLAGLQGVLQVNLTTNAAGANTATWGPELLINNIELRTNTGVSFWRTSGRGMYFVNRRRNPVDYKSIRTVFSASARSASIYNHPAAPGTSANVTVAFPVDLRTILGEREMQGLLLAEGRSTLMLDVTFADAQTALYAFTNPATINSVTFIPEADTFLIPNVPYVAPAASPVIQVIEESRDLTQQVPRWYPRNRGALLAATFWIENSAGVIQTGNNTIQSYRLNFGNTQTPVAGSILNKDWVDLRENDGDLFPDGVHVFDNLMGNGDAKRMPSLRDVINVADGDDIFYEFTLGAVPAAGSVLKSVCEYLKPAEKM